MPSKSDVSTVTVPTWTWFPLLVIFLAIRSCFSIALSASTGSPLAVTHLVASLARSEPSKVDVRVPLRLPMLVLGEARGQH